MRWTASVSGTVVQEGEEFLMPMALFALGKVFVRGDIEGGEQGRSAMTDIVVGNALYVSEPMGNMS